MAKRRMTEAELRLRLYSIDTGLMTPDEREFYHRKANDIIDWADQDRTTAAAIVKRLAGKTRTKKPKRRIKRCQP